MDRLSQLPSETLWQVFSSIPASSLAHLRFVSRKMRLFADHPMYWRHVILARPSCHEEDPLASSTSMASRRLDLWTLRELDFILRPHCQVIRSIKVCGVRDDIVRFILTHCHELQSLTLCGWTTLSNHAFKQLHPRLKLQRLQLVGAKDQPNYTAMDATTLAQLLLSCPLQDLTIGCQIHIHAATLLMELTAKKKTEPRSAFLPPPQLQRLSLGTRRTWSLHHIRHLFDICPALISVALCPTSADGTHFQPNAFIPSHQDSHPTNTIVYRSHA
ncbi:hypothetical protein DM01DRAFT_1394411 [Hesseltinella vesiculosa]|uniref:F-box domain-containing protein n=1 Tax=Hesseltinella vesiculosa TaxID=101127 RepID=A0A1X2GAB5_9FUNG|nr:hypothetical protein DM01DRAFT_1394411 [Hesseltinella vesiculosa]